MNITFKKLTPELLDTWLNYFDNIAYKRDDGSTEEWHDCYCMHFHWGGPEPIGELTKCQHHSRAMAIEYIKTGWMQGYLAFDGEKIIGWCNTNNKHKYTKDIRRFPKEDKINKVKSVVCINICPQMRKKGIGTMFLEQICKDAAAEGYDYVEAYPRHAGETDKPKDYNGPLKLYKKLGFEVHKTYKYLNVVRKYLTKE